MYIALHNCVASRVLSCPSGNHGYLRFNYAEQFNELKVLQWNNKRLYYQRHQYDLHG